MVATGYTLTHDSFYSGFCVEKSTFVHNMVRSEWDKAHHLERSGIHISDMTRPMKNLITWSYTSNNVLTEGGTDMHFRWRFLPFPRFSQEHNQWFVVAFQAYIDRYVEIIHRSESVVAQIRSTIFIITNSGRWLGIKFDAEILASTYVYLNGTLARTTLLFDSFYLVYLPRGIKPLQLNFMDSMTLDAMDMMRSGLIKIDNGLEIAQQQVNVQISDLKMLSNDLATIQQRMTFVSVNATAEWHAQPFWYRLVGNILGPTPREQAVYAQIEFMVGKEEETRQIMELHDKVAAELSVARAACIILQSDLDRQYRSRMTANTTDWVFQQTKEWANRVEQLEADKEDGWSLGRKIAESIFAAMMASEANYTAERAVS